jgi:CRP-like cAMP-binding protein
VSSEHESALAGVDLFEELSKRELKKVAEAGKEIDFRDGATVTKQGDKDARFYLVLEGEARAIVNGRKRGTIGPGGYFGEISLIDGEPRSATIVAETPLRTFSLASFNFRALLRESPTMAEKLLVVMCRRLRSVEKSLTG